MVGVSSKNILNILNGHLDMFEVSASWVLRMLSVVEKQRRDEFLYLCSENKDEIFNRIFTGDQTLVHHYESESKQEYMHPLRN